MSSGKVQINILLVDDKPTNLMVLEEILKNPEWNLVRANSGNEALGHLLDLEFACVLLDVRMPDMDGFELATLIRGDNRTMYLPILFVTGHNKTEEDVNRGYELGAIDYLLKPLDPIIVRSKVSIFAQLYRKEVERRRAEDEVRLAKEMLEQRVHERTAELAKEKLKLERSNKELEQFASVAAHDLRSPLKAIRTWVDMLEMLTPSPRNADLNQAIEIIKFNTSKAHALIEDLLAVARINVSSNTVEEVDLNRLVQRVLKNLEFEIEDSQAEVEVPSLPIIYGVEKHMEALFSNLIRNSLNYRSPDRPLKISVGCEKTLDYYEFFVKDNGIGIDPKYQGRIFEMFRRLHNDSEYSGTGIGLAFCKKVVELSGGRIWVNSALGNGSSFSFTYPAPGEPSL